MEFLFDPLDPRNALYLGAGPQIRKIVKRIIEKRPALTEWANAMTIAIAFVMILTVSLIRAFAPVIEAMIGVAITIAGGTSVYNDWRSAKAAATIESIAVATEASPEVVEQSKPKTPDFNSEV